MMKRKFPEKKQRPQSTEKDDSNPGGFLDQEMGYLESKLGVRTKEGAELLEKELKQTNLFELFTCVDHILGKKKSDKKHPQTREEYEQALREMEAEEAEEEELSGDLENEELGSQVGEEEEDQEDGFEEMEEEEDNSQDMEEQSVEEESTPISSGKRLPEPAPQNPLSKRKPELSATKVLEPISKEVDHNTDVPNEKLKEIVDALLDKTRDNKELLNKINKICGSVHKLKLNGRAFAKATLNALEIPSTHKVPKTNLKKEEHPRQKENIPAKQMKKVMAPPKMVDPASVKDRLRSALYTVSMFPNKFTSEFYSAIASHQNPRFTSWTLSGLFALGLTKGQVLLDYLSIPGNSDTNSAIEMEKVIHLFAAPIRAKEPSLFKTLCTQLKSTYVEPEIHVTLNSHLEKLRNNLTLPGTCPFEVSNTAVKLLEKMMKKRRTDTIIPFESLDSLFGKQKASKSQNISNPAQAGNLSAQPATSPAAPLNTSSDNQTTNPVLDKLADRLELVTNIERQTLAVVTKSNDYIEVVHGLIALNTHGSENKEAAGVVLKCCLQEKRYNPFYAAVAKKACALKEGFKYSFQLALWEEVKQEAEAEEAGEPTAGLMTKLSSFAWELMADGYLDYRFFKFLDADPLPKCSAILAKKLIEQLAATVPRENLRLLSKKLSKLDTVARNSQKIVRYIRKQREGVATEEEQTTLKRMEGWLEYVPNFDEPEADELDQPKSRSKK